MTDRYQVIRDALPILIAEAQAKGGRNERAALIVELLEERDALLSALEKARAFIDGQSVRTETVGKSVYLREDLGKVMRIMSTIDAALEATSSKKAEIEYFGFSKE